MRETGYYWVKYFEDDEWTPILYSEGLWHHKVGELSDQELDEINDTRILNPDEK